MAEPGRVTVTTKDIFAAHSFDVQHPEAILKAIEIGKLGKLNFRQSPSSKKIDKAKYKNITRGAK